LITRKRRTGAPSSSTSFAKIERPRATGQLVVHAQPGYQHHMATGLLFKRNQVDEVDWTDSLPRIGRSAILWIDLEKPNHDDIAHLVDALTLVIARVRQWI